MLVLSRKAGEGITVNQNISIEILSIEGDRVRIGIQAPKDVRIYRKELLDQTIDLNRAAVKTPNISFGVVQP
ncbi:MAG: carbon storage regulator CsrA [Christensenellales bacterium]|jgi:carbon storage regulator